MLLSNVGKRHSIKSSKIKLLFLKTKSRFNCFLKSTNDDEFIKKQDLKL